MTLRRNKKTRQMPSDEETLREETRRLKVLVRQAEDDTDERHTYPPRKPVPKDQRQYKRQQKGPTK
jgi:hypothetical protein